MPKKEKYFVSLSITISVDDISESSIKALNGLIETVGGEVHSALARKHNNIRIAVNRATVTPEGDDGE